MLGRSKMGGQIRIVLTECDRETAIEFLTLNNKSEREQFAKCATQTLTEPVCDVQMFMMGCPGGTTLTHELIIWWEDYFYLCRHTYANVLLQSPTATIHNLDHIMCRQHKRRQRSDNILNMKNTEYKKICFFVPFHQFILSGQSFGVFFSGSRKVKHFGAEMYKPEAKMALHCKITLPSWVNAGHSDSSIHILSMLKVSNFDIVKVVGEFPCYSTGGWDIWIVHCRWNP